MLTRVARMYHEEGLPQREIALRLSLSQSRVSRLLRRAVDVGVVRTFVVAAPEVHAELEDALRARFGLLDAVVVDGDTLPALRRRDSRRISTPRIAPATGSGSRRGARR